MNIDWETVAAVWGAGLSTWLAIRSWITNRPLITIEPAGKNQYDSAQYFFIRLKNTTQKPVCIRSIRLVNPAQTRVTIKANGKHWRPDKNNKPRNLVLYPRQHVIVQLDLSDLDEKLLAILHWDFMSASLNLPRFAVLIRTKKWISKHRNLDHFEYNDDW